MKHITGTKTIQTEAKNNAVTLGKFDGIHLGHRKLMDTLLQLKNEGYTAGVFTFDLSELQILRRQPIPQLLTAQERAGYLDALGIDWLIEYPFDRTTREMDPEAFVRQILCGQLHAKAIVIGEDFHFGRERRGDAALLARLAEPYGYRLFVLEKERDETGREISSTYVREELVAGHMEKVRSLLGYPYYIRGLVAHGLGLAVRLGFPTMNQIPDQDKMLPPYGVYCSRATVDGIPYDGITNIGCKPTVSSQNRPWVETYLWDYSGNAYGKEITVELYHYCRRERPFSSTDALIEQMTRDVETGKEFFRRQMQG